MTLIQQTLKKTFRRGQAKKIAYFFRNSPLFLPQSSPHLPRLSIFGTKKKKKLLLFLSLYLYLYLYKTLLHSFAICAYPR